MRYAPRTSAHYVGRVNIDRNVLATAAINAGTTEESLAMVHAYASAHSSYTARGQD